MEVRYRESFLRDLKKLKKLPIYERLFDFAFRVLPNADDLRSISGVKAMSGHKRRYRIRVSSFRIGLQVEDSFVELVRVLDRRDFYRYFP